MRTDVGHSGIPTIPVYRDNPLDYLKLTSPGRKRYHPGFERNHPRVETRG
ncbi:MAG: hypothetical protein AB3N64_04745 [Puniceicoccaceae bacterium]